MFEGHPGPLKRRLGGPRPFEIRFEETCALEKVFFIDHEPLRKLLKSVPNLEKTHKEPSVIFKKDTVPLKRLFTKPGAQSKSCLKSPRALNQICLKNHWAIGKRNLGPVKNCSMDSGPWALWAPKSLGPKGGPIWTKRLRGPQSYFWPSQPLAPKAILAPRAHLALVF